MTQSSFQFHLLKVSIAQLLKAHGFDKCNNRILDVLTDLYIRYLNLLLQTVTKYMESRNESEPILQDLVSSFIDLKVISPASRLDAFDINPLTLRGLENFENWFQSDMNSRLREVARPNEQFLKEQADSINHKDVHDKMNSLTAAFGQPQQQQQPHLHQHTRNSSISMHKQGSHVGLSQLVEPQPTNAKTDDPTKSPQKDDALQIDDDWIKYLVRQQLKQKPESKFSGTVLESCIPEDLRQAKKKKKPNQDFLVVGPTPGSLLNYLPYTKNDEDSWSEESSSDLEESSTSQPGDIIMSEDPENRGLDLHLNQDADGRHNSGLNEFDYYEHHDLYNDGSLGLYEDSEDHNLNLFGN